MCSTNYEALPTYKVLANIPIQDTEDFVTAEQLPIAAIWDTHSNICITAASRTCSPVRFYLWYTVSPNDDNKPLGQLPQKYISQSSHTQGRARGQGNEDSNQHLPAKCPDFSPLPHHMLSILPLSLPSRLQYALCLMTPWGSTSLCYCKSNKLHSLKSIWGKAWTISN